MANRCSDSRSSSSSISDTVGRMRDTTQGARSMEDEMEDFNPLLIPRVNSCEDNPFLTGLTPTDDGKIKKGSDADRVASGQLTHLNLTSQDGSCSCECSMTSASGSSVLQRSQSELRQSPLRNYYANACRGGLSEGFSSMPLSYSPRTVSPPECAFSTPPLSARMYSEPSDVSMRVRSVKPRRSADSCSERAVTAHAAFFERLQSKIKRAQGEPLTPYLM